jgi:MoaA/NifB/PqqE/SkfB family radical SAM enzyme
LKTFHSIVPVNQDPFVVTWDLGRRCNYDCSYCPSHRHDNFSPHSSLEQLIDTTEFLFDYISVIAEHRNNRDFHVSFTGGEPTVNPDFIEFSKYIKEKSREFSNKFNLQLSLTTNGAMGSKLAAAVIENFDYVTVSYHCEAHDSLKKQVLTRIEEFARAGTRLKVNVMFHAEWFDECKDICNWLKTIGVKYIPRLIGDDPDSKSSQAHLYTEDQKQWLKTEWNIDITPTARPCCGGRTFGVCSSQGTENTNAVTNREFKDWSCSVNWYFLHIEQQTRLVFHHQTCQARLDSTRGPIGHLDSWQTITGDLKTKLEQKSMPIISCPNKICGCGLCTPKSENRHNLLKVMPAVIKDISIFN